MKFKDSINYQTLFLTERTAPIDVCLMQQGPVIILSSWKKKFDGTTHCKLIVIKFKVIHVPLMT